MLPLSSRLWVRPPPDAVLRLVDRFSQDHRVFLSSDYKEEQLRAEFLNGPSLSIRHSDFVVRTSPGPFFSALGWDLDNKAGLSEFSVIANPVHSSWSTVPGTEDRKPGTKNREPETDEVIRLTAGHQAKVEEEPEVRKAGGKASLPALDLVARRSYIDSINAR